MDAEFNKCMRGIHIGGSLMLDDNQEVWVKPHPQYRGIYQVYTDPNATEFVCDILKSSIKLASFEDRINAIDFSTQHGKNECRNIIKEMVATATIIGKEVSNENRT